MTTLTGRHVIVTGGGRGIGLACAEALAREGASLTLMGRVKAVLEDAAESLAQEHGIRAEGVVCDVSDEDNVAEAFEEAIGEMGTPWALVNNAGQALSAPLLEITRTQWDTLMAVNATGPFLCMQAVLPSMLAAGAGRIVNVASTAGLRGASRISAYVASKHALVGLTRAAGVEYARKGITVNAVCPGYTETEMSELAVTNLVKGGKSESEARAILAHTNPRGAIIQPEEVATAVTWLCSPDASGVTGTTVIIAAGEIA